MTAATAAGRTPPINALPSTPSRKISSTVLKPRLPRHGNRARANNEGNNTAAPQDHTIPGLASTCVRGPGVRAARGWVTM